MSCPWITNRTKKTTEKTLKYGPLRWELKQQYQGYEVRQYNIIIDVLGGWSRDLDVIDEGVSGKQEQESVAEHAEGGVIGIPEYCPDF